MSFQGSIRYLKGVRKFAITSGLSACLAAGATAQVSENLSIGGYGELHLNSVLPDTGLQKPAQFDFHRFVLMFGYRFNERWSFNSELELEHNFVEGNKKSGYLILEQAYIQWQPCQSAAIRMGILLQPQGLINENHEPTTFSSVERPEYHRVILPSTWFGTGIAVTGDIINSLQYDFFVTEGLDNRKFGRNNQGIREARQKGFYAGLDNVMTTLRLAYIGMPGFRAGASAAVNHSVSDRDTLPLRDASGVITGPNPNRHIYKRAVISEFHAAYTGNGFRTSVEFAHIGYTPISGRGGTLVNTQGLTGELGYDIARLWQTGELTCYPFVRISRLNTGGKIIESGSYTRIDGGIALQPMQQITLKADIGREIFRNSSGNRTLVNAGFGYDF